MRPELSFDGHGINGPDEYRSRIATFANGAAADAYGKKFAATPELISSTVEFLRVLDALREQNVLADWPVVRETLPAIRAAVAKATA